MLSLVCSVSYVCAMFAVMLCNSHYNVHATELEQIKQYLSLTQSLSTKEYFESTTGCIRKRVFSSQRSPPRTCRKNAFNFTGTVDRTEFIFDTPLCNYELHRISTDEHLVGEYVRINLTIVQFQCKLCAMIGDTLIGGSSLRVQLYHSTTAETNNSVTTVCKLTGVVGPHYMFVCYIHNSVTHRYDARHTQCVEPRTKGGDLPHRPHRRIFEFQLLVILDYEMYYAFHESFGASVPLGWSVINQSVCVSVPNLPTPLNRMSVISKEHSDIYNRLKEFDAIYFIGASHMRYMWDEFVLKYFGAHDLIYILPLGHGDQQWKNTAYIRALFSMELPGILREICTKDSMFYMTSVDNASKLSQSAINKRVVLIVQTGSWDLDYAPVRNLMEDMNPSSDVWQTVKDVSASGFTCVDRNVSMVWVTPMPVPECAAETYHNIISSDKLIPRTVYCTESRDYEDRFFQQHIRYWNGPKMNSNMCFDRGYRNNYVLAGMNQYFKDRLLQRQQWKRQSEGTHRKPHNTGRWRKFLSLSSRTAKHTDDLEMVDIETFNFIHKRMNLIVVDAFNLIFPWRNEKVCGLHYLCRNKNKENNVTMERSRGGEMLFDTIASLVFNL